MGERSKPEPIQYRLREADIRDMIADGSIDKQHFLIRLLAEKLTGSDRKSEHQ